MSEPLSISLYYTVLHGVDEGRVGRAVDVLPMEEIVGGWWGALCAVAHGRLPRRWRMDWIVLEFEDSTQGAFRRSELEERHVG